MEYLQNKFNEVLSFLKYVYLIIVFTLTLYVVMELKHIYEIDIFPGIDTPFDNVYYKEINPLFDEFSQYKA